jgi:DNA invertase Pin-like site-specific DNA recombinase
MRVAIYARCSTNESRQDVENQIDVCKRHCQAQGWECQVFQEYESAFKSKERKVFNEVIERVRMREFNGLMVYMLDRFSRETPTKTVSDLHRIVEVYGCRFISVKEGIDSKNEMWQIIMMVFAYMANNYSKMLGVRVREGIQHKKAKGEYAGGRPQKKINEVRLRGIARGQGLSLREIARAYNVGLPRKEQISHVSIKRLLQKHCENASSEKQVKKGR